jgi:ubiquinone/menaquinone biosynthesis C-methylase UbiE
MTRTPHLREHRRADAMPEDARGVLLDRGWRYDLEVWIADAFVLRGRLRELRRRVLDLAAVGDGQSLLDVGCGTGTLALEAAAHLGPAGRVAGIDPAPRQVARAQAKARRKGMLIDFQVGSIDALPFPDASFDAVTSTLVMHHLPADLKQRGLAEILRVLRPEGRLVVADFIASTGASTGRRHRTGHAGPDDLAELISGAGFAEAVDDRVPFRRAHGSFTGAAIVCGRKPLPELATVPANWSRTGSPTSTRTSRED